MKTLDHFSLIRKEHEDEVSELFNIRSLDSNEINLIDYCETVYNYQQDYDMMCFHLKTHNIIYIPILTHINDYFPNKIKDLSTIKIACYQNDTTIRITK